MPRDSDSSARRRVQPRRAGLAGLARAGCPELGPRLRRSFRPHTIGAGERDEQQLANCAERPGIVPACTIPFGLAFGERWFAVNTQPFAETRAQRNLENQGFRTFMPRRRKMVRHARN